MDAPSVSINIAPNAIRPEPQDLLLLEQTETNGCVTVRDRDTMQQVRIPIEEVRVYIEERLVF